MGGTVRGQVGGEGAAVKVWKVNGLYDEVVWLSVWGGGSSSILGYVKGLVGGTRAAYRVEQVDKGCYIDV